MGAFLRRGLSRDAPMGIRLHEKLIYSDRPCWLRVDATTLFVRASHGSKIMTESMSSNSIRNGARSQDVTM